MAGKRTCRHSKITKIPWDSEPVSGKKVVHFVKRTWQSAPVFVKKLWIFPLCPCFIRTSDGYFVPLQQLRIRIVERSPNGGLHKTQKLWRRKKWILSLNCSIASSATRQWATEPCVRIWPCSCRSCKNKGKCNPYPIEHPIDLIWISRPANRHERDFFTLLTVVAPQDYRRMYSLGVELV